jgi:hypothetical protein
MVRVDSALGFHQIFRPIKRVSPSVRAKLEVEFMWKGATLRFVGPNQLDIGDQSTLLAVLQVAQEELQDAKAQGDIRGHAKLAKFLNHLGGSETWEENVLVRTSFRRLARLAKDCGSSGGSSTSQIQESLARLTETTVWSRVGRMKASSRLLAWEVGDDEKVLLSLNWRLVAALCGRAYSKVSIDERRRLPGGIAKAVHFMWSCQIKENCGLQYRVSTLQNHVWGECPSPAALRKRRERLFDALGAVGALGGWIVDVEGELVKVRRRRASERQKPELRAT